MEGSQSPITYWLGEVIKSPSRQPWLTKVVRVLLRQVIYCSVPPTDILSASNNFSQLNFSNLYLLLVTPSAASKQNMDSIPLYIHNKLRSSHLLYYLHVSVIFSALFMCFPRLRRSLNLSYPLNMLKVTRLKQLQLWYMILLRYTMNHIMISPLGATQGNTLSYVKLRTPPPHVCIGLDPKREMI